MCAQKRGLCQREGWVRPRQALFNDLLIVQALKPVHDRAENEPSKLSRTWVANTPFALVIASAGLGSPLPAGAQLGEATIFKMHVQSVSVLSAAVPQFCFWWPSEFCSEALKSGYFAEHAVRLSGVHRAFCRHDFGLYREELMMLLLFPSRCATTALFEALVSWPQLL